MLILVDASSSVSLAGQIRAQVRAGIVAGALRQGERLPPARELANGTTPAKRYSTRCSGGGCVLVAIDRGSYHLVVLEITLAYRGRIPVREHRGSNLNTAYSLSRWSHCCRLFHRSISMYCFRKSGDAHKRAPKDVPYCRREFGSGGSNLADNCRYSCGHPSRN